MNDNYRIQKITKRSTTVSIAVEKPQSIIEKLLSQVKTATIQQLAARAGVPFTASDSTSPPSSPTPGWVWFQTDTLGYYYYDGSDWQQFQPVP